MVATRDSGPHPAEPLSLDGERARSPRAVYATLVRELAHLDLDEGDAQRLWRAVRRHRLTLRQRLGRDVGRAVALLDYLVNLRSQLTEPRIMERAVLEAIERQAVVDSLTGLYNRNHFETQLVHEIERARRYGSCLSLLLLDLDGFKEVNDLFGHQIGDQVLEAVGALLLEHVRAPDVPCRYGGDEFAVVLPDTSLDETLVMSERIRVAISCWFQGHPVGGRLLTIGVSGGVASVSGRSATAERLLARADRALYRAKAAGGDRVLGPVSRRRRRA